VNRFITLKSGAWQGERQSSALRDCLSPCHPPRYEFMKRYDWVYLSMAVLSDRHCTWVAWLVGLRGSAEAGP